MNLFSAARGMIGTVKPSIQAVLKRSTGATQNPDGTSTPTYAEFNVLIDVQATSSGDLMHVQNVNQQAEMRIVYMDAYASGISRADQTGGDLLTFEGSDWLVTMQFEAWGAGRWVKLLVSRQLPSA